MKTDYKNEITALLKGNYEPINSPAHETELTMKKTLKEITREVKSVLPSDWIEESDVYEVLTELGFKSFMYEAERIEYDDGEPTVSKYSKLDYFLNRIV